VVGPWKQSSQPRRKAANSDTLILIGKLKKRNDAAGKKSKFGAICEAYLLIGQLFRQLPRNRWLAFSPGGVIVPILPIVRCR